MPRLERQGDRPPADLKLSADDLDLPLKGTAEIAQAPTEEFRPSEPREPRESRQPIFRPSPLEAPAPARWPWIAAAVVALVGGAAAGWFLKPDPPVALASSELLDFGEVRRAATSSMSVEIVNAGESALAVSEVFVDGEDSEEFTLTQETCSGQALAAQGACTVEVAFTPRGTGTRRGWLVIHGLAANGPPRLPLRGLGVAPQLEAEPLKVDFGEHLVGTASPRSSIRLANRGSAPLAIQDVQLAGAGAGDFAVKSNGCSGKTLAPNERCTLQISFLPTLEGTRSATVRLAGANALAELSGNGLPRQAVLALEPGRLEFEPRLAGTASEARSVTFTNDGTAPLTFQLAVRSETGDGGFELTAGECAGKPLVPRGSCTADVVFRPAAEGDYAAVLEVRHGDGTRRVPLAGAGTIPKISLDSLVLDFGQVPMGRESDSKFLKVINSGSGPLDISQIRVRGSGAQAFNARPVGCTTAPIKPKSSCGVEVRFKPHRGGAFSAQLTIQHNAGEGTSQVEMRGLGKT